MSADAKPSPIVTSRVCSACGLSWDDHGDKPSLEDCVRLLKAALAQAHSQSSLISHWPITPSSHSGHQCGACKQWVPVNTFHVCAGEP